MAADVENQALTDLLWALEAVHALRAAKGDEAPPIPAKVTDDALVELLLSQVNHHRDAAVQGSAAAMLQSMSGQGL